MKLRDIEDIVPADTLHALGRLDQLLGIGLPRHAAGDDVDPVAVQAPIAPGAHRAQIRPDESEARDLRRGAEGAPQERLDPRVVGEVDAVAARELLGEERDIVRHRHEIAVDAGDGGGEALGRGLPQQLVGVVPGDLDRDQQDRRHGDGD